MPLADYKIFLDDERMPGESLKDAVIVRDFWEFKRVLNERGVPKYITFDHDLGFSKYTGKDCAEYLIARLFDTPELAAEFEYDVHSQNPVGAENIRAFLNNYLTEMSTW